MNILRPLSPHLPIYKPQLTSTFPISHRISGQLHVLSYDKKRQVLPRPCFFIIKEFGSKPKYGSIKEIYRRTLPIEENNEAEEKDLNETFSQYLEELNCPTLSPPRVKEEGPSHQNEILPSSSESFSDNTSLDSDIETILSPNIEREVVSKQSEIEDKVFEIANENGFHLSEEEPYVLGQWVHGESSNPSTLNAILNDLHEKKEKSEWFSNAIDVYLEQFFNPSSPLEKLVLSDGIADLYFSFTNPSLFMLLTLSLVLLLVHFVTRRGGNVKKKH